MKIQNRRIFLAVPFNCIPKNECQTCRRAFLHLYKLIVINLVHEFHKDLLVTMLRTSAGCSIQVHKPHLPFPQTVFKGTRDLLLEVDRWSIRESSQGDFKGVECGNCSHFWGTMEHLTEHY